MSKKPPASAMHGTSGLVLSKPSRVYKLRALFPADRKSHNDSTAGDLMADCEAESLAGDVKEQGGGTHLEKGHRVPRSIFRGKQ